MFLLHIWIHKQYTAYFPHFNTLCTWSIILCIILQLKLPPAPQIGISLVHSHQIHSTLTACLLFSSHLEECVTNNIVMNVLGHIPPGNRLTFFREYSNCRSSYKSFNLTRWSQITFQDACTNSHSHQWQGRGLAALRAFDTWYSQVLNVSKISRWVASLEFFPFVLPDYWC